MSPSVHAFHAQRLERMLRDLDLDPGSVAPDADFALYDHIGRRRLTPPLNNQTLAEGLTSALKIAAWRLREGAR